MIFIFAFIANNYQKVFWCEGQTLQIQNSVNNWFKKKKKINKWLKTTNPLRLDPTTAPVNNPFSHLFVYIFNVIQANEPFFPSGYRLTLSKLSWLFIYFYLQSAIKIKDIVNFQRFHLVPTILSSLCHADGACVAGTCSGVMHDDVLHVQILTFENVVVKGKLIVC